MYLRPKRGPQTALGGRGGSVGRRRRCRAKSSLGDPKGRDPQEWTRLVFDYYKHLATLNGVGVAVMLTVYRQEILDKGSVTYSLVLFELGVLCCALGMICLIAFFHLSAQLAGYLFTGAAVVVVGSALDLPKRLVTVVLVVLILGYVWALSGRTIFGYGFPHD
jgi:hypothetical protein